MSARPVSAAARPSCGPVATAARPRLRPAPHHLAAWATAAAVLAGCAVGPKGSGGPGGPVGSAGSSKRDGPPASPPPGLAATPDAEPRIEPVRPGGPNKPYVVLGQSYTPQTGDPVVHERGLASWYGAKFHGRRTASGEVYNMYAMTAAHRTLPIPSYARVRNPANGREVIVRINDRGPFHRERVIDLSYTAALKLGVLRGVAPVELERLTFEQIRTGSWRRDGDPGGPALTVAQAPVPTAMPAPVAAPAPADVQAPAAAEPAWTAAQTAPSAPAAPTSPPASLPLLAPQATEPLAEPLAPSPPAPEGWGPRERAAADDPTPIAPRPALATPAAVDDRPPDRGRAYTNAAEGWWLQLGAFRRLDGAEALRQKVARDHAALAPLLTVFNEASLFRLQAGPYASRSQARLAATRLGETLADAPVIVERR